MSTIVTTNHGSTVLVIEGDEIPALKELLASKEMGTLLLEHHASGQLTASWSA